MSRNRLPLLAVAPLLLVSGCADYLNHYESIPLAAGDTQNYNILLQTREPFNPASYDTRIRSDGTRAATAVRKYQLGVTAGPAGAATGTAPQGVTMNTGVTSQ